MKKISIFVLIVLFGACKTTTFSIQDQSVTEVLVKDYIKTNSEYMTKYNYFEIKKIRNEEKCLFVYRIKPIINTYFTPTVKNELFEYYPTIFLYFTEKHFFGGPIKRSSLQSHSRQFNFCNLLLYSVKFIFHPISFGNRV